MNSPVIFAGALTIFARAVPRGPHPGDGVVGIAKPTQQYRLTDYEQ